MSNELVLMPMFHRKRVLTSKTPVKSIEPPLQISKVTEVFALSLTILAHWLLSSQTEWLESGRARASLQKFIPIQLKFAFPIQKCTGVRFS